jgi:hypothetical protein
MKLNSKNSFILGYLICMIIFWLGLYLSGIKDNLINRFWGLSIDFLALFGGVLGILVAKQWGNFKSMVGRGILFLSSGIVVWSLGNFIFSYYVFFQNVSIPYPSVADIFFIGALPLWMIGMFYFAKASGVQFGLKSNFRRSFLFVVPIMTSIASYYLLVVVARAGLVTNGGGVIKVFFDLAYPIGDTIIATIALLVYSLSFKYLGGKFKIPVIFILLGFVLMFFADFAFSYTTTLGIYYGGSAVDPLFVVALFLMGFGLSSMDNKS